MIEAVAAPGLVRRPLIVLDAIQRVSALLDAVQHAIDIGLAQFVLIGSSASMEAAQRTMAPAARRSES